MVFHSSAMRLNFKEGVGYLTFPALESYPFVRHAFSTRLGEPTCLSSPDPLLVSSLHSGRGSRCLGFSYRNPGEF